MKTKLLRKLRNRANRIYYIQFNTKSSRYYICKIDSDFDYGISNTLTEAIKQLNRVRREYIFDEIYHRKNKIINKLLAKL